MTTENKMPENIWAGETRFGVHGVYGSWSTNEHPVDHEGKIRTKNRKRTEYTLSSTITARLEAAEGLAKALEVYMLKVDMHEGKVLSAPMPSHNDIRRWKTALLEWNRVKEGK